MVSLVECKRRKVRAGSTPRGSTRPSTSDHKQSRSASSTNSKDSHLPSVSEQPYLEIASHDRPPEPDEVPCAEQRAGREFALRCGRVCVKDGEGARRLRAEDRQRQDDNDLDALMTCVRGCQSDRHVEPAYIDATHLCARVDQEQDEAHDLSSISLRSPGACIPEKPLHPQLRPVKERSVIRRRCLRMVRGAGS